MNLKEQLEELKQSGGTVREITDAMLVLDQSMRDLGKDCSKEALKQAKKDSKVIYSAIKEVDLELGKMLILNIDM